MIAILSIMAATVCGEAKATDLIGTWRPVAAMREGQPLAPEDSCVTFDGVRVSATDGSEPMVYKLAPWGRCFRIEVFAVRENQELLVARGLLGIEGTKLTICYSDPFDLSDAFPFPPGLSDAETSKGTFIVFERVDRPDSVSWASHSERRPRRCLCLGHWRRALRRVCR